MIGGEVVAMSPSPTSNHSRIVANLAAIFVPHLWKQERQYFAGSVDVRFDKKNVFVPDGCVVCDPEKVRAEGIHGAPDLVIEILSPSTENRDRGVKMETYARHGVGEYWLIDPARLAVEVYVLGGGSFTRRRTYAYRPGETEQHDSQMLRCGLFPALDVPLEFVFNQVVIR